jgi:hypothetical protein
MPDDKEIDQVTDEVMQFLKEKHRVHDMPKEFHTGFTEQNRAKERAELREVIKSLLYGRDCEEF